ncbi:MAG: hypothetical protein NTX87_17655 [Planctomycetota bacterium]|nr:hypothetical protein [Planctomycetota bacterium]
MNETLQSTRGKLRLSGLPRPALSFLARVSWATLRLARSGVVPAVARSLARHSGLVLTMDHYTHTLIGDERAALDRLPSINAARADVAAVTATGT